MRYASLVNTHTHIRNGDDDHLISRMDARAAAPNVHIPFGVRAPVCLFVRVRTVCASDSETELMSLSCQC